MFYMSLLLISIIAFICGIICFIFVYKNINKFISLLIVVVSIITFISVLPNNVEKRKNICYTSIKENNENLDSLRGELYDKYARAENDWETYDYLYSYYENKINEENENHMETIKTCESYLKLIKRK